MALNITLDRNQEMKAIDQLSLLMLSRKKKFKLLKDLGRAQRKLALKRVRQQKDIHGQKFESRKRERLNDKGKNKKMLENIGKGFKPYVFDAERLELKHWNNLSGSIAALHQFGLAEEMTAKRMEKIMGKPDYGAPCTRNQAEALCEEGYMVRRGKGEGYRTATPNEIEESKMTLGQAGLILRTLRNKKAVSSWEIPLPKRAFLGDEPENVQRQLLDLFEEARK